MQIFLITLAVTLAVQIQASLVVFTPPILAPVAQSDVGMSAASVGLVTALIYLSSVPSALLSGSIIARLGAIRVSQLCVLFAGVGMILMVSGDAWLIAIGALTVGLGYGAVTPSSSTVLADQAPRNLRSLIFSVKQSGVPIGGAIAGALVPYLMQVYSWRFAGAVIGLIGVVVIISAEFIRKKVDSVSDRPISNGKQLNLIDPLRLVFSNRKLRELAVSSFAFSGMQMSLGSYLVVMLTERALLSVSLAGSALSLAMIAGIFGRLFWGVLADYGFRARSVLGLLGLLMCGSAFFVAFVDDSTAMVLIYCFSFVFGASAVGWNGVYLAEVARIAPSGQTGSATGASLAMTYSGVVLLPTVFWIIHEVTQSYTMGFVTLGVLAGWRGLLLLRQEKFD